MEKKMETAILYEVILGLYRDDTGIKEKNMEAIVV